MVILNPVMLAIMISLQLPQRRKGERAERVRSVREITPKRHHDGWEVKLDIPYPQHGRDAGNRGNRLTALSA